MVATITKPGNSKISKTAIEQQLRKLGFTKNGRAPYRFKRRTSIGEVYAVSRDTTLYLSFENEVLGFDATLAITGAVQMASDPHSGRWIFNLDPAVGIESQAAFTQLKKLTQYARPPHWLGNLSPDSIRAARQILRGLSEGEIFSTRRRRHLAGNQAALTLQYFEETLQVTAIDVFCDHIMRGFHPNPAVDQVKRLVHRKVANSLWSTIIPPDKLLAPVELAAQALLDAAMEKYDGKAAK
jgi:hypothetical protein